MSVTFINAGHGNIISAHRVISIVGTSSAPIKRYIDQAEAEGKLITIAQGRKWRSAIITDSNHVILSSLQPETIANRIYGDREAIKRENVLEMEVKTEKEDEGI